MDYEDLTKELRRAERYCLNDYSRMAGDAAAALTALLAENEKLWAELEQVKHQRDSYRLYHDDLASKPNCNTCADKDCKYRPIPGDTVRANCPLWRGSEEG